MAVVLPQAMPAIHMGDQYDLTRLQDNTKTTVDLLLQAVAALQTSSVASVAQAARASLGVLSAEIISGSNLIAPVGSGELIVMPAAGSIISLTITSKNAAGTDVSAPSAGSLTAFVYRNAAQVVGPSTTLTTSSGVATSSFVGGTYNFNKGDYLQIWRSSTSLANPGTNRYIFGIWVAFSGS